VEAKAPSAPKIPELKEEMLKETKKPTPRGIVEMEAALDEYAASLRKSEPPHVMGGKFDFTKAFATLVDDTFRLGWPPGLFIPGLADSKQYWFMPPAPGMNRYTNGFAGGNSTSAKIFNPATGQLFAYAAARPTDPFLRSEAGIGFMFTPKAKLATYRVEATVSLNGQHKYDVNTEANAGGRVVEWGGLYLQAWDVSPVDGSTSAVSPNGAFTLFGEAYWNLQGGPNPTPYETLNGPVATNIMLEGSHTYLITVTAVTQIVNGWTMNDGKPMQAIPDADTWRVWSWIGGTVTQVLVEPTAIYIP
jgi:hypothetical protein